MAPCAILYTRLPSASVVSHLSTTSLTSSARTRAAPSVSRKGQMTGRLGIVAGGGQLPRRLVESCRASGRDVFVLALEGAAEPETVRGVPHAWCRMGAAVTGLSLLRENHVTELVLAGSVRRPSLVTLRPDWRAAKLFARIGYLDIGQAVVVQQGLVLGVEAVEGTDELLRRCAALRREGPGGVLVKVEKPGQERRADRPTIGHRTVVLAAETGLLGIAIEAEATIVLDRDEVIRTADRAGLFVVGIRRS